MSQIINVRQLHGNLKNIALQVKKGKDFIVMKYSTPLFRITPINASPQKKKKPYGISDLADMPFFQTDEPDMSQDIDTILASEK